MHSARERRKKETPLLPGLLGDKENPSSPIPFMLEINPAVQLEDKTQGNETSVVIISMFHC